MRRFTRLHCWILALLLVTPLPLAAQEPGKVRRIGLFHVGLDHVPPSLVRKAAATLKLQLTEREATVQADIERAFGSIRRDSVDGVFLASPNLQTKFTSLVLRLATEKGLPLPGHRKEFVQQGALFSYAPDYASVGRDAARYVDKILKGTKPGDLPVEQMSRLSLVVNLKAAKALGLTISQGALVRADEVIQ